MEQVADLDEKAAKMRILSAIVSDLLDSSSESDDEIYHLLAENSDSEDDAAIEEIIHTYGKTKIIKGSLVNVMPEYNEDEFMKNFRISKDLYKNLLSKYEESEAYTSLRADKRLPAAVNMSVFLWFAGHEACSFSSVSERFNLPKSSICRIIDRVTAFIYSLRDEVIIWPTAERKEKSANFFENQFGFSKAMGCIDVTHIGINPPSDNGDDYINQKGIATLCVQAVCDEQNRFIDVFVKYPGSSHPNRILYNSSVYANIATLCEDYYLIGPSSYPCSDWILTPFTSNGHLGSDVKLFNFQHMKAHDIIRSSFSELKQRFKQLKYCKLKSYQKLCNFIEACCILHNLSIGDNFEMSNTIDDDGYINNVENTEPDINDETRKQICEELWSKKQKL